MKEFHNPQSLTPDQFGGPDGFRLLTVEELATLSDPAAARSALGRKVALTLKAEFYRESTCRWHPLESFGQGEVISSILTYRTRAAIPPEFVQIEIQTDYAVDRASADFVESFNYLAAFHHEIMIGKGFWDSEKSVDSFLREHGRNDLAEVVRNAFDGQKLALQTTEVSETVEALRHGNPPDDKIPEFSGAEAELADVILRLMDQAHGRGWRVAEALIAKMQMNATRAAMHGGKKF